MTVRDDISGPGTDSGSQKPEPSHRKPREIHPEAETRGGPEAPDTGLGESPPGIPPNAELGSRAALPPGSLPGPHLGAQGDENREPPPNAPAPVNPAETVADARRTGEAKERRDRE